MKLSLTIFAGPLDKHRNHLRDVEGLLVDTVVHFCQASGAVAPGGDHVVVVHTGILPALAVLLLLSGKYRHPSPSADFNIFSHFFRFFL